MKSKTQTLENSHLNCQGRLEIPQWYVIYTHPRQEERAESNLTAWHVETLNPKFKEFTSKTRTSVAKYSIKQLFPRYIFARFVAGKLLHKVGFTRGVHSVVCFGHKPSPVDDSIIALIRSKMCEDGYIHFGDELKRGDKVVVKNGPLSNLVGVFEHKMSNSDRVQILLTTVNYQVRVVLEREQVHKLNSYEQRVQALSL